MQDTWWSVAIDGTHIHKNLNVVMMGAGMEIPVSAPYFYIKLIQSTTVGWDFREISEKKAPPVIAVAHNRDRFRVDSIVLVQPKENSDLIASLNEFFLCLVYLVAANKPKLRLLHCAGFKLDGNNLVVVGPKRAGKSCLALRHALLNRLVFADDLLLWAPHLAKFFCLGLPLRIRRPIPSDLMNNTLKNKLLSGKRLAYSHRSSFKIAPLGHTFILDELCHLDLNHQLIASHPREWYACLSKYIISSSFSAAKKTTVDVMTDLPSA